MSLSMDAINSAGLSVNRSTQPAGKDDVGQDEFLKLMLAQFENQDPMKPLESGEFLGQLAQFSTATGMKELKDSFQGLVSSLGGNQGLSAAQLVGRDVLLSASEVNLTADGASGVVDLPQAGELRVHIQDATGQTIRTLDLGRNAAGFADFQWDGRSAAGDVMPEGRYSVVATVGSADRQQAVPVYALGRVTSVAPNGGEPVLNVAGLGEVSFGAVRQIR
ncbi:MAG: flagellar hook capping protein [Salinisphaeraceae bacterium]|jgi:flagellar basal-body rod modification protein FlgD|nr:flagellar hook capping protein [Salinisphaeraceae bacterium]